MRINHRPNWKERLAKELASPYKIKPLNGAAKWDIATSKKAQLFMEEINQGRKRFVEKDA